MSPTTLTALAVVVVVALVAVSGASSVATLPNVPVFTGDNAKRKLDELATAAGLTPHWRRFFLATAAGESRFVSNARNTDPDEAAAATTAYERGVSQGWLRCPTISRSAWTWGSGGWFGQLPANAWYAYRDTSLACRDPRLILHPVDAIVTSIAMADRITRLEAFAESPTYLRMRVAWASPSLMRDAGTTDRIRRKFGGRLEEIGESPSFMDLRVDALPELGGSIERLHQRLLALV